MLQLPRHEARSGNGIVLNKRNLLLITIAAALLACAFALDRSVASHVRTSGSEEFLRAKSHSRLRETLKAPGVYYFTLCVAVIVSVIHEKKGVAGFFLAATTAVVSGMNWLLKWIAGRLRPFKSDFSDSNLMPFDFHPFRGGWRGGFGSNLCFPSGHAMLAFATAAALVMLFPRWRWRGAVFLLAGIVAAERVLENAHWLSDAVAAVIMGVGGLMLTSRFYDLLMRGMFAPLSLHSSSAETI